MAKPQLDKKEEPQLDRKEAEEPAAKKTKLHARGPPPLPQEVLEDTQPQPAAPATRVALSREDRRKKLLADGWTAEELEEFGFRPPRPDDKDDGGPPPIHPAAKWGGREQAAALKEALEKALKEAPLTEETLKEKQKR